MHENEISHATIGAAIEVHREVGPGIIEKLYEEAMCHDFHLRGLRFVRQKGAPFIYKGVQLSTNLCTDSIVEGKVIVDLKAKDEGTAIDKLKVLTCLRLLKLRLGLVINLYVPVLKNGIHRVVNNVIEKNSPTNPLSTFIPASLRLPRLWVSAF
jgi:GxxExxY protein